MKLSLALCLAWLAAAPALALAGEQPASTDPGPRFEAYDEVTDSLTIVGIDAKERLVSLRNSAGDTIVIKAGPEVRNFAQLRVKDKVVTTYKESFTVDVDTTGVAGMTRETVTARAPVGATPGGSVHEKTQMKATISSINKEKGTVTLTAMNGEPFTLTPLNRANLDKVKVGDVVVFTHTVSTAISVHKPGAQKAAPAKKTTSAEKK